MFTLQDISMEVGSEGELPHITVHPDDLFPAIVARIKSVLAGEDNPHELGVSVYLVDMAKRVPARAWEDALAPRVEFHPARYTQFSKEDLPDEAMLGLLSGEIREEIERMVWRGVALRLAYHWFSRSLPNVFGKCSLHITAGKFPETFKKFAV